MSEPSTRSTWTRLEANYEQMRVRRAFLDRAAAAAEERAPYERTPEDHATADCPGCQYALRPADAGETSTWPVVNQPGLDAWLRHIEPDDAQGGKP